MMLKVKLFGQFDIQLNDAPIEVPTRSAQSLLAYLLLNAGIAHRRVKLAGLFWPDTSESSARNNLRHALWRIRKAIGHDHLLTDNVSVMLDPASDYWLDAAILETAVGEDGPADELIDIVAVYTGELLPGFYDDWVVLERERLKAIFEQQIKRLLDRLVQERRWDDLLHWGEHWIALGQSPEPAYRALMVAHAELGNRASVAAVYQRCVETLREDLDVEPSQETRALYERLSGGETLFQISIDAAERERVTHPVDRSDLSTHPPAFLDDEMKPREIEESVFVERERELSQLDGFLKKTLAGRGQVAFITGDAGQGKTSLVREFVRRSQETYAELIVASGHCNAYAGVGDPYLPFRDVMDMLTGTVEAKWFAGAITREHARRLWHLLPETVQALIDFGPDLIDVFVPGAALIGQAMAAIPGESARLERLKELTARKQTGPFDLEQSYLFEQYVSVLQNLAARHPLLITLDDLQWADAASISLLFHLGRRMEGSRILIVGAYRPDEVAQGLDGERHPLEKVLGEFKRTFGDIWVELAQAAQGAEGRRFVDVLLDTQLNQLDEEFRQALFRQTGGHPLFTIELLRAMQARGDLVQDEAQGWVEGPVLDWQVLPARVEAVIEERIGRLDAELREILAVASVEGESFTPEVMARVQGLSQRQLLHHLSQELEKRHRLVRELEEVKAGQHLLSRYQFAHILFQRYLYDSLSTGERRLLHGEIARALEALYEGHTDEIAAQLSYQFREAGERDKAIECARQAARRAQAAYAYDAASQHLQTALDLIETGDQVETQMALLEELADVYVRVEQQTQALFLYQAALDRWSSLPGADAMIAVRLHRKILHRVTRMKWSVDYEQFEATSETRAASQDYLESYLILSEAEPPHLERVRVLTVLANIDHGTRLPPALDRAERYAQAAVALAEQLDAPKELAEALNALADIYFERAQSSAHLTVSRRLLALSRDPRFGNLRMRSGILAGLANAMIAVGEYAQAIAYLIEAEHLVTQNPALGPPLWTLVGQALCWLRLDRWDELSKVDKKRQDLEKRYSREQFGGSYCAELAVAAAGLALQGDFDQARVLREQAYVVMVQEDGVSTENWGRTQYY